MLHKKFLTLGATAVIGLVASSATSAQAMWNYDNNRTGASFTSHESVQRKPYHQYAEQLSANKKFELRRFLDYQDREPCQNYRPAPSGFKLQGCDLVPIQKASMKAVQADKEPQMQLKPVIKDYEIHFAFDSDRLSDKADDTLDKIAGQIKRYDPDQVTVAGHTDRAGPANYNERLSHDRAQAVSQALTDMGIRNRVINKKAYGESMPKIETANGVPLRENRRVVVEFRK